jgi:hypothetical protein
VEDDPTIVWDLANIAGIQIDPATDAWHSGHVTDILELPDGDSLLVASETGGVWSVTGANPGLPLSGKWDDPDVQALAWGPDGNRHVFAGCSPRYPPPEVDVVPVVMETNAGADIPLLEWEAVEDPLPSDAGSITDIVVIRHLRRIVVACESVSADKPGGIFWADIPPTSFPPNPPARPPYVWERAVVDDPAPDGFNDLAVASTKGNLDRDQLEDVSEITIVAGARTNGLFFGRWRDGQLVVRRARQFSDGDVTVRVLEGAGACSVDSCKSKPNIVYAVCANGDGTLMQVVRSEDGGQNWKLCGSQIVGAPLGSLLPGAGDQGNNWNNCIAVDPSDGGIIALGWQKNSPTFSLDGGETWIVPESEHLHDDLHALTFSLHPAPDSITLFVGSDGGVASITIDFPFAIVGGRWEPNARSDYNQNLPTLQCYSGIFRQFYGSLDASPQRSGLVAVGLQDNGNVYSELDQSTPWLKVEGGDGGWNAFLVDGGLVHNHENGTVQVTVWGAAQLDNHPIPLVGPAPNPDGLVGPYGEPVVRPNHRNASGHLLAAAGGTGNQVYGLWIDENPDATRYYWEPLATLPGDASVGALCSFDGRTVYAGTHNDGRMFAIDTANKSSTEQPVVLPKPHPNTTMGDGSFIRIVAFDEKDVFAILDGAAERPINPLFPPPGGTTPSSRSYVVRLAAGQWENTLSAGLPGHQMYGAVAVQAARSRVQRGLLVSTDDAVYISRDDGASWQRASRGLPRRAHCADLRFAPDSGGHGKLYLGTYGRSVWVAPL